MSRTTKYDAASQFLRARRRGSGTADLQDFETLLVLVRNSGRVVTKEELMRSVWPDTIVEEIGLARNICSLRKSLGDSPSDRNYVATVPGRGYRFVTSVHEEFTNDGAATREGPEESSPTQTRAMGVKSIAVLPFKPLGTKVSPERLRLGHGRCAHHSAQQAPADHRAPNKRGACVRLRRPRSCGGGHHAEGGFGFGREHPANRQRIRVTVQLLSVPDGHPLWADKFDGTFIDIFAMQDSISEQVTAALALKLSGRKRRRLTRRYTESVEAYRLYLEGQHYWNRRTPKELEGPFPVSSKRLRKIRAMPWLTWGWPGAVQWRVTIRIFHRRNPFRKPRPP